jgi:hypothetical protein
MKKKKTVKDVENPIAVTVSRFGHDPIAVVLNEGATVEEALEEADIDLDGREQVFVAGERAGMDDEVEDKDVLSVVTPKQAGNL